MSFATTLSKLLRRDTETRQAAAARYQDLVRDAAADRGVTEAKITETLEASGHSLADLERDVAAERERLANLSVVARRDELMAELAAVSQQQDAAEKEFRSRLVELQQSRAAIATSLAERRRAIDVELWRVAAAERALTLPDERLTAIRHRLGELAHEERRVRMSAGLHGPLTPAQRQQDRMQRRMSALADGRLTAEEFVATTTDADYTPPKPGWADEQLARIAEQRESLKTEQASIERELLTAN